MPLLLWLVGIIIGGAAVVFAMRRFLRLSPPQRRRVGVLTAVAALLVIGLGLLITGNASGLLAVISAGMVWLGRARSLYGFYHSWFGTASPDHDDTARQRWEPPPAAPQSGPMTREEAWQVLGLQAGATPEEIRRAHRALMRVNHPDQGGSVWLAARINQARDLLLNGR